MGDTETKNTNLILSGDPAKDFPAFLKSKEKPFDLGLELIKTHTKNFALYTHLQKNREEKFAKKMLLDNIKVIAIKWLKK
ncbi:MAG: hypothetical protein QM503_10685 [Bacteroidota bacterium]